MRTDKKIETEKAHLEKSLEAYAKKDLDGTMKMYAPDGKMRRQTAFSIK